MRFSEDSLHRDGVAIDRQTVEELETTKIEIVEENHRPRFSVLGIIFGWAYGPDNSIHGSQKKEQPNTCDMAKKKFLID